MKCNRKRLDIFRPVAGISQHGESKTERGPHFLNTILDVCSNRGLNMKWGAQILNGGTGTTAPPTGDNPSPTTAHILNKYPPEQMPLTH